LRAALPRPHWSKAMPGGCRTRRRATINWACSSLAPDAHSPFLASFYCVILSQKRFTRGRPVTDPRSCGGAVGVRSPLLSRESVWNIRGARGRRDFRHRGGVEAYVVRAEA